MFDTVAAFFQSGGAFMYPILLVLAIGCAMSLERYIYLSKEAMQNRRVVKNIMPLLKAQEIKKALAEVNDSKVATARLLKDGLMGLKLANRKQDIEASMEETIMEITPRLEKRTHYLALFANIATLLGLLGTIIGLIKAFTAVAQVDPSLKAEILSGSISVAMNTTAFGLIAAIPLLIFHSVLQTKTTEIIDSLEMAAVKFANQLQRFKAKSTAER